MTSMRLNRVVRCVGTFMSLVILWPMLGASAVAAEDVSPGPEFVDVRTQIEETIAKGQTPSLAVAVVREGQVVWAEGFGLADINQKRPATSDTMYRLASVSKPIA